MGTTCVAFVHLEQILKTKVKVDKHLKLMGISYHTVLLMDSTNWN